MREQRFGADVARILPGPLPPPPLAPPAPQRPRARHPHSYGATGRRRLGHGDRAEPAGATVTYLVRAKDAAGNQSPNSNTVTRAGD
ncbi:hypothetical protein AB0P12_31245, partial [Streptomyces subrutilus]|uniref:hypothetical protein n=1 Tax=Streptomyces subrutilus TaxID=36818 RepID=UPI0034426DCC